jgi:death-on-curing protein
VTEPVWLSVDLVMAIHEEQLAQFGGAPGLRDRGLLESALARPLNRQAYGTGDRTALAASYAFGLARNHAFVDGDKRVALLAMVTFLGLNGIDFVAPESEAVVVVTAVAAGEIDEEGLTRWIRDNWPES